MRKLILGLALIAGAHEVWSDCLDTTVVIRTTTAGYSGGVYDPDVAGGLNSIFKTCPEPTITVRLNIEATLAATLKDTLKLSNSIKISDRAGKSTALTMSRASTPPAGVLDTLFTLLENTGATSPNLLTVTTGNQVTVTNMAFARKMTGNNTHSVVIGANRSVVTACHFWMADNSTQGTGALLDVTADSVLVERSLFRSPPDGVGRPTGVHTGGNATRVEIRANVFFSTGLQMAATGTFHVIANTFTGSRNEYNAIIIGGGIASPNNAVIMHNLFAHKVDTLPPISFAGASVTAADSIWRNAWSRGKPNLALAVLQNSPTSITLNGASGVNVNTPLPRGFSNYGPASGDVKDYPLTQLRGDPLLARKHNDFGKIYRVFLNPNWTGMNDVSVMTTVGKMYFPGFSPFLAGKSWLTNVKVGAFVDQDTYEVPSPLDSGAQGASLKFTRDTTTTTRIKMTQTRIDANYYKATLVPEYMYFFFSNTLSKLTASNDTNTLKNAPNSLQYVRKQWLGDDSLLTVPKEVRTGGDIYVKMLHFRLGHQAAVQSNAVIATVTGFPSFPVNDLKLSLDVANSNPAAGVVVLTLTRGSEPIDSVRILTNNEAGQTVGTDAKAVSGTTMSFTINIADKGNYSFTAVPVAKIGTTPKAGQPTNPPVGPIPVRFNTSDSIYVTFKTGSCTGADGSSSLPFCGLDTALKEIATKKGGTIIIRNGVPIVNLEDIIINNFGATDTSNVTITSGRYDENRPIIRGKTREAITINRKNVTLRGFTIEMPVNSTGTALNVKAGGCVIDANIFRAASKGAVEGVAANIEVGATAEARFVNNVVWGYTKNILITNSASPNIKVINNTFVDDPALANAGKTTGILLAGTGAVAAVFANNYFSGVKTPVDATLAGKTIILDHNVYTLKSPNLQGIADAGGLDSSSAVASAEVWTGTYTQALDQAFSNVIDCNSLSPCNSIYAGSSATPYNVTLATDVLGRQRVNRKEVGAYEFAAAPPSVLGVLEIIPTLIAGTYKRMDFVVVGKNFDPHPKETDSVHVFWTTADVTSTAATALAALPATQKRAYPISKLESGSFKDVADSITKENTKYFFFAALSRNSGTQGIRKLGFAYSDTLHSSVNLQFVPCHFEDSKSACPSETGIFGVDTGTWKGKFESRIILSEAIAAGDVDPPAFNSVRDANVYNLDLTSPLPTITFNTKLNGLGTPGSKQKATWQVEMYTTPELGGLDLFLLPSTPDGMAQLVPYWTSEPASGGKTRLTIETSIDGLQTYAFGKVQPSMDPGQILTAEANPPIYDFDRARDSAVYHIPMKIKGSAFKTGNPLVLVSIIPAGGSIAPAGGTSFPKVVSKNYHSRTLALSAGYAGLTEELRKTRFHQHYLKAVLAEGASGVTKGQAKPFVLDSMDATDFAASTEPVVVDLSVAAGNMDSTTILIPVGKQFKDYANYSDKKGKASRSIEVVFTTFDGGKISRTRAFIRTKFIERDLQISEKVDRGQYTRSTNKDPKWNLFGYPWDEADTGSLARIVEKDAFNIDNMRIMKYKGSGDGPAAFIAYDGNNISAMKYDSGMAIWSGSTGAYTPKSASGMSLDFQQFNLDLAPGQWNDISLPFNFDIKWQDVLDSSGKTAANAPALWHYVDSSTTKWVQVTPNSTSPPVPGTILKPWDGYTIKPTEAVTLKFPVMDIYRSTTPVAKPAADDGSWAVKIEALNATAAMELRIGRGARESWFPEAPNIPGQDFRVALTRTTPAGEEKVSQHYQALGADWMGHWALRGSAAKGSRGIALRLAESTREVQVWLLDAMHGTAVPLSKEAPIQVGAEALAANEYHLVAGDQAYVDGILKGMVPLHMLALGNYPNPFSASTLIRYSLPAGFGKVRYEMKVRDFRGRTVWEKTVQSGNALSYLWDGRDRGNSPLPAGVYSLSLSAHAEGKPVYRAVRGILKM